MGGIIFVYQCCSLSFNFFSYIIIYKINVHFSYIILEMCHIIIYGFNDLIRKRKNEEEKEGENCRRDMG